MKPRCQLFIAWSVLALGACRPLALPPAATLVTPATATTNPLPPTAAPADTAVVTPVPPATGVATSVAVSSAGPGAASPTAAASATTAVTPERPAYDLTGRLDAIRHTLDVEARITFAPPASGKVVFNFSPALTTGGVEGLAISAAGQPVAFRLEGAWLHVDLPAATRASGPLTFTATYRLRLRPIAPLDAGWRATLGWTPTQTDLGDWYPALAVYDSGRGWVTPPAMAQGEYHTTPLADYVVRLEAGSGQMITGSGRPAACGTATCFAVPGARYVAYVASDVMPAEVITSTEGVAVTSVFMVDDARAGREAGNVAARAIDIYGASFGRYPLSSFVLAEGDFYDGMEYSGMAFVGRSYYREYDGTPRNLLTIITAHEVAHQWWHTRVGNDPAAEPWMDEALATYSELIYLEAVAPEATTWWWDFRIAAFQPQGAVNAPLAEFQHFRTYVDAVYLRGAQMLHAMRRAIGDDRFFAFLRDYADANAGRIASGADFWHAYAAAGGEPLAIQAEYFR